MLTPDKSLTSRTKAKRLKPDTLQKRAAQYRNPHISALLQIAGTYATRILKAAPGATVTVGGSLRSGTAILGKNDIDLRVLLPSGQASPAHMAKTSALIHKIIPFEHTLERPPYLPLAYHHKKQIKMPKVGTITVEANIQPRRGYYGLATKSARLPAQMRHHYLILKGLALDAKAKDGYKQVKNRWAELIHWLTDRCYFTKPLGQRPSFLKHARSVFPEFFINPPGLTRVKNPKIRNHFPA